MSVRLRIDRIMLDGYDYGPRERSLFEASLTAELTRLLADGELGGSGSVAIPAAVAPLLDAPQEAGPAAVGSAVARSVHAGIPR